MLICCLTAADTVNQCLSNPCQNSGACVDESFAFQCTCKTGFSGTTCATRTPLISPRISCFRYCVSFICASSNVDVSDITTMYVISVHPVIYFVIVYHIDMFQLIFNFISSSLVANFAFGLSALCTILCYHVHSLLDNGILLRSCKVDLLCCRKTPVLHQPEKYLL